MNISELLKQWQNVGGSSLSDSRYHIKLSAEDAAKLHALCELFPRLTIEMLIGDLLHLALDELEAKMPYVRGERVTGHDEHGDPFYEDVGLTPRYMALVNQYLSQSNKQTH